MNNTSRSADATPNSPFNNDTVTGTAQATRALLHERIAAYLHMTCIREESPSPLCSSPSTSASGQVAQQHHHHHHHHLALFEQVTMERTVPELLALVRTHELATDECLAAALMYVQRFVAHAGGHTPTTRGIRPLFVTALLIANKYVEDCPFDNRTFAHLAGLHPADIACLELAFLHGVAFSLHCSPRKMAKILDAFWLDVRANMPVPAQSQAPAPTPSQALASAATSLHLSSISLLQSAAPAQNTPPSCGPVFRPVSRTRTPSRSRTPLRRESLSNY